MRETEIERGREKDGRERERESPNIDIIIPTVRMTY